MKNTSSLPKKTALVLFSVALLLTGGTATVRGQSALDGFDPNANAPVHVVVVQPDGKILIGGEFTTLSPNGGAPVTRNRIARLNADGTLDTAFNPNADGTVLAIVVQADGKIVAGGGFLNIGGQMRNHLARLEATTGAADPFNPNADLFVSAIAVQPDGKILAGGIFKTIGGQTRNSIARLDATTGLADSFNPNASPNGIFGAMNAIVVQADGKILVGGSFTNIGGLARTNIARLEATTGLADSFAPNANSPVQAIAVQADGKILVGGGFTSIGGQSRRCIARLDAATGLADSFDPNAIQPVYSIAVQTDGKILAGGYFTTIGGQTRNRIARLDPSTGLPDTFDPSANEVVLSIAVQADGKILAGGNFTTNAPNGGFAVARKGIARLETDGRLDRTLALGMSGSVVVYATAVQPDGKILIGGSFSNVLGAVRNNIARLNTDGTLDNAFNPNANGEVEAIAVQADGKILVGGGFAGPMSIGGQLRNYIARLDPTNGLADSFNPNAGATVYAIAVQADGKILVGGMFNIIGGPIRNRIARLDATNGLADSFDPNASNFVSSIVVQTDGRILVGGAFTGIGGQPRNYIARLDATTGLADTFNPSANNNVYAIAVQPDGKVLVGGQFNGASSIGGQFRNRIARLDATNGLADSFNPNANGDVYSISVQADGRVLVGGNFSGANSIGGQPRNYIARLDAAAVADPFNPSANSFVSSITVLADGKILAGGFFTSILGQSRNGFARLNNDTVALQNLAATQSSITWTRVGSSPQFTRVTFESSTNYLNYAFLGNGTPAGTNWTLSGLNLSSGQNLYIRARGYYRSGNQNGSESIAESVRNVFLPLPPQLNIQRSGNANVVLSWATHFSGFTLESNTNLNTNVWSTVTPTPVVSGTNNVVTNATSGTTRFYRLRKP
jgi:uncharacterized delta-60 repeat protein